MRSTDKKVSTALPRASAGERAGDAPGCNIDRVEHAVGVIEGRWKLLIVHHLLIRSPQRFSELERAIPAATQKMLIQQLRALEAAGIVERTTYPQVPPKVEYALSDAGRALEPVLYALHDWAASKHLEATAGNRTSR